MTRIEEIAARLNVATPGPWTWQGHTPDVSAGVHGPTGDIIAAVVCIHADPQEDLDAALIAHARDDLPWLLSLVRELQGALEYVASNPRGCLCDPPGSGEEHCTDHCTARVALVRGSQSEEPEACTHFAGLLRPACFAGVLYDDVERAPRPGDRNRYDRLPCLAREPSLSVPCDTRQFEEKARRAHPAPAGTEETQP